MTSDDITGEVLHRLIVLGLDHAAAVNDEAEMQERHNELDNLFVDLSFPQKHFDDLVLNTGAVCGKIAVALYGRLNIPETWQHVAGPKELIVRHADGCLQMGCAKLPVGV